ncbi:MAG TPA: ATP-binding protein [Nitrospirota bacterium]|nr:ATP-binding protein [Nitrospirota bacterium]
MTQEFSREEYYGRIKWLIVSRAVLVTLLLGTLIFFQHEYRIYPFPTVYLYYFVLSIYVLTGVYWFLLQKFHNLSLLAYLQISTDILFVTFFVYLTGGIDSGFSLLYNLTIISASIILYRRGGYLSASLSSILYGAMLDMQYYNMLGLVRSVNFTAMQVLYLVFINISSFYIVALLSGYLSDRLRKTSQELRAKSMDYEDLRTTQDHILKSVRSGILTMDLEGEITSCNPAAEYITGYSYAELKSRWQDLFGSSIKVLFGHTNDLMERPFRFDGPIVKKDGDTAILGTSVSLLKDDKNTVHGIILIFQDITKLVEMEEKVRRQEQLAVVGSLAAGIAHEIRNPLASLSGSIQVLQGELDLKGDEKHLMDIVVRETDRLNTIISEFLEYARPQTAHVEKILLLPLLDETIMLLKNSRDFREGITIRAQVDPQVVIQGDAKRMRQVFWNLLINACQAMPDGGEITVSTMPISRSDDDSGWCEIVIKDTGRGIAHEYLDKIFDPFFTTKSGGTGLGLAIVDRIIEDHGGIIDVESETGRGTKFRIRLPVLADAVSLVTRSGSITDQLG